MDYLLLENKEKQMDDKELKLFNEICYIALINSVLNKTASMEYEISPNYITEKSKARDNSVHIWKTLHSLVKLQVKQYCDRWDLPLQQWLNDLGIKESILNFGETNE